MTPNHWPHGSAVVELLAVARDLIDRPSTGPEGTWPKAAALLARQELEAALTRLWETNVLGVERSSMRTQLACLDYLSPDPDLSADVRAAWHALSRACHHHQFELAPTAPELHHWLDQVEHLTSALDRARSR